jgi:2-isopropylmalate synthase
MTPESVGVTKTKIVLGRHSGRHGLKSRLAELGYHLSEDELNSIYQSFLDLADKKKEIYDEDLRTLMGDQVYTKKEEFFELEYIHVTMGTNSIPTATVKIKCTDGYKQESATGDGSVDACFNAIERALELKPELESYHVRSVTSGRQALGEVIVRIRKNKNSFTGRGVSTDIIEASAKAYLQALNQQLHYLKHEEEDSIRRNGASLSEISQAV